MPVRTRRNLGSDQAYRSTITCGGCGEQRTLQHDTYGAPRDAEVERFIRYLPGPGRYHSRCRSCEREYGRNRAQRRRAEGTAPSRRRIPQTDRRFGVELELMFPASMTRANIKDALIAAGCTSWSVKGDGSLSGGNGMEVVSPPLRGDAGMEQVEKACRALRALGAKPNRSCGLHVHHEIRDLNVDAAKRFVRSWYNNQDLIDGLVAPSRRNGGNMYCGRLTVNDMARIDGLSDLRYIGVDRYRTINLNAYGRYGTVEVRQHQGTCDFEKIRTWILFGQAMIASSYTEPLPVLSTVRDLVTRLGDAFNETARTFLLGRAVEFAHARVM
jgi:hypothetical protein